MHFNPHIENMIQQAHRSAEQNQWQRALDLCEQIRQADPVFVANDASIQRTAGMSLAALGRFGPAERTFERVLKLLPNDIETRIELATMYRRDGRAGEALELLRQAVEIDPNNSHAVRQIAAWHMDQGNYDTAETVLAPLVAMLRAGASGDVGVGLVYARLALAIGKEEEALVLLARFRNDATLPMTGKRVLFRRLGELNDQLGHYDEAFAAFSEAQRFVQVEYDPQRHSQRTSEVIAAWTPEKARALPRVQPEPASPRMVFVLGMPRSGTSLVERIIGSHSKALACGEQPMLRQTAAMIDPPSASERPMLTRPDRIDAAIVGQARSRYMASMETICRRLGGAESEVLTDKQPYNYFYIPLIAAMFPGAKILHTVRDPIDTCLSNYFQFFGGSHPHIHNLEHLGRFYADYQRLMDHWMGLADDLGVSIHTVRYEDIIQNTESTAQETVSHAGLEWEDTCLRFHETKAAARTASNDQVRKPIYTSSLARRDHYEKYLGPLHAGLGSGSAEV